MNWGRDGGGKDSKEVLLTTPLGDERICYRLPQKMAKTPLKEIEREEKEKKHVFNGCSSHWFSLDAFLDISGGFQCWNPNFLSYST